MILKPCPIPSNMFSYSKGVFTVEASSLYGFNFDRVYDDACDIGFTIHNKETDGIAVFAHSKTFRDVEDDVTHDEFECVFPPKLVDILKVVIFND